ncbi:MAG: sirohydrochlorin cobaltochelatase [Lachnospiraceae bacterium]|nr:sirohydrochlorin cobaltochelatase [Lachnospiraceae bacterium]
MLVLCGSVCLLSGCGSSSGQTDNAAVEEAEEDNGSTGDTVEAEAEDESGEDSMTDGTEVDEAATDSDGEKISQTANDSDEEEPDTGDAALDNPRNGDGIGEKELLVASFGTSYNDSRRLTIGAIEQEMEESEPDFDVRRAFTSQMIIDHVKDRDGVEIDNVTEALDRAVDNGVKSLVVMPTHLMDGLEYHDLIRELGGYVDSFEGVAVGAPLLSKDEDYTRVAEALADATSSFTDGKTAICFMGHGTEAASNGVYERMQQEMESLGHKDIFIGTVEATPTLEDVLNKVKEGDYTKVVLRPMMVVAGDHANNDMAGDDDDSWKSVFESEGYEVECVLEGIAQIPAIRELYADHAKAAIETLSTETEGLAGNFREVEAAAKASDEAAEKEAMANAKSPEELALSDGTYEVEVELSGGSGRSSVSSPAEMSVENGTVIARIEWSSEYYDYMKIDEEKYLPVNTEGNSVFEIPVSVFDAPMDVVADTTAMSQPHEVDYQLTFASESIREK